MFSRRVTTAFAALALVPLAVGSALYAAGPERELAGITLGRPAVLVLKKYGNPSQVIVGSVTRQVSGQEAVTGAGPESGMPTRSIPMPGGLGGGSLGLPDIFRSGALPGVTPGSVPTGPMAPGYAPTGTTTGKETEAEQMVTWRYAFPTGITVDFAITAGGSVTRIEVSGLVQWASSKTSRGIKLGSTYKDVLFKYGYPESQEQVGNFLRAYYLNKYHVIFTFLGKNLVGITAALPTD